MQHKNFSRIILYARKYRAEEDTALTINAIIQYLQQENLPVFQTAETYEAFGLAIPVLNNKATADDLVLVVGGDGSLLTAARLAVLTDTPVIGINRGHLGFLTDIAPQEIPMALAGIIEGKYHEETRFLLSMTPGDTAPSSEIALNDIVINRGKETHMIDFTVYIDDEFVNHYRADGLILATPTGSTAYALSAGGPIMHPALNAILLVPMFAHTLSARPLVIDAACKVEIKLAETNKTGIQISCDGHISHDAAPGMRIRVSRFDKKLRLLHPLQYRYYDTLRIKLGWGNKPTAG